jgi:hypothetical protein
MYDHRLGHGVVDALVGGHALLHDDLGEPSAPRPPAAAASARALRSASSRSRGVAHA